MMVGEILVYSFFYHRWGVSEGYPWSGGKVSAREVSEERFSVQKRPISHGRRERHEKCILELSHFSTLAKGRSKWGSPWRLYADFICFSGQVDGLDLIWNFSVPFSFPSRITYLLIYKCHKWRIYQKLDVFYCVKYDGRS